MNINNNETKKNNLEQIKYIKNEINDYLKNKISIDILIRNLENLIYSLKKPPKGFVDSLISPWSRLEICYANMLYEKRNYFTSQEQDLIKNALTNILKLIEKYKDKYLSNPNE
jgi:hypothetical protein